MPRLIRKKFVCFYCGCRSAQDRTPGIREWQCEKCEAPNHLDEDGEITDPPAFELSSAARFAQSIPRAASPEFATPDESLFCSVCLQNQKFLTESLASYFPPPNALDYPEYEKNYPEYRKNLENRYPQVCRQCEPRVRDRIRLTGYAAKSDHLRRMMERSRGIGKYQGGWNWKRFAISAGAIGWCIGQAGQFLWNAKGAIATNQEPYHAELFPHSLSACLWSWDQFYDTRACGELYDFTAGIALGFGLLSIWWNPRLKEKIKRESGRILGLQEYYKLQAIFALVRFVSWTVLVNSQTYSLDTQTTKAAHSFMLIFTILSIIISFRTVQFDPAPIVLFQDSLGPLIQETATNDPQNQAFQALSQPLISNARSGAKTQAFSLNDLAPTSMRPRPVQHKPPTPPPDEDEYEAMDWTPSQQSLPPASRYHAPTPVKVQPSPFYGHLPPDPISQAHRLRNPPNQPAFRRATTPQKQSFFQSTSANPDHDDISDVVSEAGTTITTQSGYTSPQFNPPRFFPNSDYERDTGLESIFSKTFSLAEEPHEVRVARGLQPSNQVQRRRPLSNWKVQILCLILFWISSLAWYLPLQISHFAVRVRLTSLGVAVAIAGKGLFQNMTRGSVSWSWSNLLIYSLELCAAAFFGSAIQTPSINIPESQLRAMVSGFLGVMLLQELWVLISGSWRSIPPFDKNPHPSKVQPPVTASQPSARPPPATKTPLRPEKKLPVSDRTTRSKSRLEKSTASSASGLNNLSRMSALGLSESRSTRRV